MKTRITAFALASLLAACGGGGSSAPSQPTQPTQPPTQQPDVCVPASPAVVNIYGDSTNVGQYVMPDGTVIVSVNAPDRVLQRLFDAHFGPMKVKVNNLAVGGSTLMTYRHVRVEGLSVLNHGINDSQAMSPEQYREALREVTPTFFETPNPVTATRFHEPPNTLDAYAQVMREVGKERGIPVLDSNAYVKGIPNWEALIADTVHPGDELYRLIATNVLYPAFLPLVAKQLCKEAS